MGFLRSDPTRNPFKHLHLQLSLDRDRNHVVTYCLILSNHSRRTALQTTPLRNLCVLRVSALDFSSLGLILNLQLSTFNRVSFLSSHLSLSQRSSKSFTIRTSETPLPQPLYNPHLRAPLGSAGNKGLITPLESALTKNSPASLLESALTKRWGWGYGASLSAFWAPVKSRGLPPPEMQLRDVLRLSPFLATHPENRLLTPIIATLPKPLFTSPLLATHPRPSGGVMVSSYPKTRAFCAPARPGSPRCRGYLSWATAARRRED